VTLRFRDATTKDVAAIAGLLNATAGALTARFGEGRWSSMTSERSVELSLRHARLRVGVEKKRLLTTLRLAPKKPWAIDIAYFTPARRPLYLNLADAHEKAGDLESAALAVKRAAVHLDHLPAGGYRELVASGIRRLAERLDVELDVQQAD